MKRLALLLALVVTAAPARAATLRVLTLNIWLDGADGRLPGVIELIKRSKADIVGLQECEKTGPELAKALGFHYIQQGSDIVVLSRWPIEGTTPNKLGVYLKPEGGRKVAYFNIHPYYLPYQPYQLLGIPYGDAKFIKTEAEAVEEARKARGKDIEAALEDLKAVEDKDLPVILGGDFNEPSHLDWTEAAAKAHRHPVKVEWPSTKAFEAQGFKDAYREKHPDEMKDPGYTWTPTTKSDDPKDHHDRIDFILYRGKGIRAKRVDIVGESKKTSSVVLTPYPSDHRGVLATFKLDK